MTATIPTAVPDAPNLRELLSEGGVDPVMMQVVTAILARDDLITPQAHDLVHQLTEEAIAAEAADTEATMDAEDLLAARTQDDHAS